MDKKHRNYLIIAVLFVVLFLTLRLKTVYEASVLAAYEVIPSTTNEGFSLKTIQKRADLGEDEKSAKIELALKPGDTHRGTMLIKNYEHRDHEFMFKLFDDIKPFSEDSDADVQVEILSEDPFVLKGKEWRVIPYIIHVSPDAESKIYKGLFGVGKTKLAKQDGTNVALLVGVEAEVEVSPELEGYEYVDLMEEIKPSEVVWQYMWIEIQRILAGIFAVLSIYFMYKAFSKRS